MRWGLIIASAIGVGACASIAGLDPVDTPPETSSGGTKTKTTSGGGGSGNSSGTPASSGNPATSSGSASSGSTSGGSTSGTASSSGTTTSSTSSSTSGSSLLGNGATCGASDECQSGKCGPDARCTNECNNEGKYCGVGAQGGPCCLNNWCPAISGLGTSCEPCLNAGSPPVDTDGKSCCKGKGTDGKCQ